MVGGDAGLGGVAFGLGTACGRRTVRGGLRGGALRLVAGRGTTIPYSLPPVPLVEGATAPPEPPVLARVPVDAPVPPDRVELTGCELAAAAGAGVPPEESVARDTATDEALSAAESSMAIVACAAAFLACLML